MDRSALPVSACLTRRNGCAVPPSTMQKISCTVIRSPKAVPSGMNDVEDSRRLAGCSRARQRRGCHGKHGERLALEEHKRGHKQLPRVDASQALRGKDVEEFPVSSHDMDMGRRAEKRQLYLEGPGMHGTVKVNYHGCVCLAQHGKNKNKQGIRKFFQV